MSKLTFVFRTLPHGRNSGREGVDALLAASAYYEDISVLFIGDGVAQLLASQNTSDILSKDYAPMFKLFDLYDIENVFICEDSLLERGLKDAELIIDASRLSRKQMIDKLNSAGKALTF